MRFNSCQASRMVAGKMRECLFRSSRNRAAFRLANRLNDRELVECMEFWLIGSRHTSA